MLTNIVFIAMNVFIWRLQCNMYALQILPRYMNKRPGCFSRKSRVLQMVGEVSPHASIHVLKLDNHEITVLGVGMNTKLEENDNDSDLLNLLHFRLVQSQTIFLAVNPIDLIGSNISLNIVQSIDSIAIDFENEKIPPAIISPSITSTINDLIDDMSSMLQAVATVVSSSIEKLVDFFLEPLEIISMVTESGTTIPNTLNDEECSYPTRSYDKLIQNLGKYHYSLSCIKYAKSPFILATVPKLLHYLHNMNSANRSIGPLFRTPRIVSIDFSDNIRNSLLYYALKYTSSIMLQNVARKLGIKVSTDVKSRSYEERGESNLVSSLSSQPQLESQLQQSKHHAVACIESDDIRQKRSVLNSILRMVDIVYSPQDFKRFSSLLRQELPAVWEALVKVKSNLLVEAMLRDFENSKNDRCVIESLTTNINLLIKLTEAKNEATTISQSSDAIQKSTFIVPLVNVNDIVITLTEKKYVPLAPSNVLQDLINDVNSFGTDQQIHKGRVNLVLEHFKDEIQISRKFRELNSKSMRMRYRNWCIDLEGNDFQLETYSSDSSVTGNLNLLEVVPTKLSGLYPTASTINMMINRFISLSGKLLRLPTGISSFVNDQPTSIVESDEGTTSGQANMKMPRGSEGDKNGVREDFSKYSRDWEMTREQRQLYDEIFEYQNEHCWVYDDKLIGKVHTTRHSSDEFAEDNRE